MRRYAGVAVVLALVALPGCSRSGPKPAELKNQTLERAMTMKVTGARTMTYSGRRQMIMLSRPDSGANAAGSVAALNPIEPIPHGKEQVRPDVGLSGVYTGDDTYELPAGAGQPVPTAGPTLPAPTAASKNSNVSVTFAAGAGTAVRFSYLLEPCSLTFAKDATEGSVRCPKLAALDGSTISFEMTWGP